MQIPFTELFNSAGRGKRGFLSTIKYSTGKGLVFAFQASIAIYAANGQQQLSPQHAAIAPAAASESSNLPLQTIGPDELIGLTVYDSPELTRSIRVDADGKMRLPMLHQSIQAAGLLPADLEVAIRDALTKEDVLVNPVVSVSVVEYRSRPIHVVGAVRTPVTFQATGRVTLLDAISQAGGLTETAGAEIVVSRLQTDAEGKATTLVQRIPIRDLLSEKDPALNLWLQGGEEVRVAEAGRVYVVGDVKRPGAFVIGGGSESSVMKVLALSEGLDHYYKPVAYIYRENGPGGGKTEIEIQLKKIMQRKAPDVALMSNDILYVPEASGKKTAFTTLDRALTLSAGIAGTLVYLAQ